MNEDKRDKNRQAWAAKTDALSDKLLCKRTFFLHFNFEKLLSPKLFRAKFSREIVIQLCQRLISLRDFLSKMDFSNAEPGEKWEEVSRKFKIQILRLLFCILRIFVFPFLSSMRLCRLFCCCLAGRKPLN